MGELKTLVNGKYIVWNDKQMMRFDKINVGSWTIFNFFRLL